MTKNILIGKITSAHGIKGAVNIISYTENPADIGKYSQIFDKNNNIVKIKLISKAKGKNRDIFIAEMVGINTRNDADLVRNTELFIDRGQLSEVADDEFYYVDLIGLAALNMSGEKFGRVIDVNDFGAGGMIEIEFDEEKKREVFPFNNDIVPEVNLKKGYLKINFPEIIEIEKDKND